MSARLTNRQDLADLLQTSKWFSDVDASIWHRQADHLASLDLDPGDALFHQGDPGDTFYLVLAGRLNICQMTDEGTETVLNEVGPGELIGEIQVLTGGSRTASVYASTDSQVIRIAASVFDVVARQSPRFLDAVVVSNRRRLNRSLLVRILQDDFGPLPDRVIRFLESQARWVDLARNEILFSQDDPGDSLYLVLQGQVEVATSHTAGSQLSALRLGRGAFVGLSGLLTGSRRRSTVRAIRDTRLVRYSKVMFDRFAATHPAIGMAIARMAVERSETLAGRRNLRKGSRVRSISLAVVPADERVDVTWFTRQFGSALTAMGSTLQLRRDNLQRHSGLKISFGDNPGDPSLMRLAGWLDEMEYSHRFVIYQCDPEDTAWSRRCLGQADQIIVVTGAGHKPDTSGAVRLVLNHDEQDFAAITTLAVVHDDAGSRPRGTDKLLATLGVLQHHHVRLDHAGDFERIARFYNGNAVGLVLGGGGARGFSHIGVLRALQEHAVPVDMIGGTSFGALIAAQYAFGHDPDTLAEINRQNFLVEKPMKDMTFPFFGLITGDRGEVIGEKNLDHSHIEDLWINFFAISANLSTAQQVVHQSGSAIRAVRASMAIPGVFVPVVSGSDLLVDGGVLNNVPVDVMRQLGGGRVIAVDVSPNKDITVQVAGGKLPSARQMFWNRLNPRTRPLAVPGLFEILMRSSTLGSIQNTEMARSQADLYIEPQLENFGTFDLSKLDDIVEAGYRQANRQLADFSFS